MSEEILYNSASIADAIKERAKERGIPLKQVLEACELGGNTISHMRHGRMIATDSLARIADYLDCSVDHLLGRENSPSAERVELLNRINALTPENVQRILDYLDLVEAKQGRP